MSYANVSMDQQFQCIQVVKSQLTKEIASFLPYTIQSLAENLYFQPIHIRTLHRPDLYILTALV